MIVLKNKVFVYITLSIIKKTEGISLSFFPERKPLPHSFHLSTTTPLIH